MDPVDGVVPPLLLGPTDEIPAEPGAGIGRCLRLGRGDLPIGGHPVDQASILHAVEEPPSPVHVVVLQVQEEHPGVGQGEPVAFPVGLHQVVLGHPVTFPSQLERVPFDPVEAVLPHSQNLVLLGRRVTPFREADRPVQELPLDV